MFSLVVCNTNEVKSPLATLDPRSRAAPGLTASKCLCSEFESLLISVSSYFLHGLLVYEIIPASSARFPCLNIQSRDRSPPRFKVLSHLLLGEKKRVSFPYLIVNTTTKKYKFLILTFCAVATVPQKLRYRSGGAPIV
jgi:hypothetical protein